MLVPVAFLVQVIFNVGLGLMLSPLCMLYPDMHRLVRVFTTLYRYLSPVIYGLSRWKRSLLTHEDWPDWMLFGDETWPEWILTLFELNPLAGILDVYHRVLFPDDSTVAALLPDR